MDIDPAKARQGRQGKQVLIVLLASLLLGVIIWVAVEFYGHTLPDGEDELLDGSQPSTTAEPVGPAN